VFLSERIAAKFVTVASGKKQAAGAMFMASALGVASPLCMFGTVPVIAAFGRKGVPQHLLAAFMIGSILLNPNIFLLSFALGTNIAIMRLILALLGGVFAGGLIFIFGKHFGSYFEKKPLFRFEKFGAGRNLSDNKHKALFADLFKAFRLTAPFLALGIVISTLFSRYVPPDLVARAFGARHGLGVLFATSLSVPLYACGGGIIPLIRAWLFAGMGAGEAMSFMIAGPATKITNISAVKMILGARHFVFYLLFCIAFAIIGGVVTGIVL
jgi:uncharacterized membrane protein YraQ (UPF0718 family)